LGSLSIPCGYELAGQNYKSLENCLILLVGSPSSGKSIYCRYFLETNTKRKSLNFFVGTYFTRRKFEEFISSSNARSNTIFINPFSESTLSSIQQGGQDEETTTTTMTAASEPLSSTYNTLVKLIEEKLKHEDRTNSTSNRVEKADLNVSTLNESLQIGFVLDSLSQLFSSFEEHQVMNFLNRLCILLGEYNVTGIFTFGTTNGLSDPIVKKITSLFDGIVEIDFEEKSKNNFDRRIRLAAMRNTSIPTSRWLSVSFKDPATITIIKDINLYCSLCDEPIYDNPQYYNELVFHEEHVHVYKKLIGVYGVTTIANTGTAGVLNGNFFFVDIVGLSNPLLSVRKQIEKIELLNKLVNSCDAFAKSRDKIVLPTGDGMAIGFLQNPELPFLLSKQLHLRLRMSNKELEGQNQLGIRIGLATGPVFIVNDVRNNQNVWGPGIILARRVMDIGDNGHILIERNLAEYMRNIDDEYKEYIHLVGDYSIKHGQIITLYTAYSKEFGSSEPPEKFRKYELVDKYMFDLVDKYMTQKQTK
jgi:class 3 adenylate cyclase/archaellum biogenesis ATPase FlaH